MSPLAVSHLRPKTCHASIIWWDTLTRNDLKQQGSHQYPSKSTQTLTIQCVSYNHFHNSCALSAFRLVFSTWSMGSVSTELQFKAVKIKKILTELLPSKMTIRPTYVNKTTSNVLQSLSRSLAFMDDFCDQLPQLFYRNGHQMIYSIKANLWYQWLFVSHGFVSFLEQFQWYIDVTKKVSASFCLP